MLKLRAYHWSISLLIAVSLHAPCTPLAAAGPTLGTKRVAVVLVSFQNDPVVTITPADAQTLVFTDIRHFFEESSYNQMTIEGDVFPAPPSTTWWTIPMNSSCDKNAIRTAAEAAAASHGVNLSTYDKVMIGFRFTDGAICKNTGETDGRYSWIRLFSAAEMAHVLAQNFGMAVANALDCGFASYTAGGTGCATRAGGDPFDIMGTFQSFRPAYRFMYPNAIEKELQGWLTPQVVTQTNTYTILPLESTASGTKALRFTSIAGDTYYLEYRQPIGSDASPSKPVLPSVYSGVLLHKSSNPPNTNSLLLDGTPFGLGTFDDFEDAAITPDLGFAAPGNDLTVNTLSTSPAGAQVQIQFRQPTDTTRPTVSFASPANGATISTPQQFQVNASDSGGIARVEFYQNGAPNFVDTVFPYRFTLNPLFYTPGSNIVFTARAFDLNGNQSLTDASVTVNIANPTFGPSGEIPWARQFGDVGTDSIGSVVDAANGDIVVAGTCAKMLDLGSGPLSDCDGYFAKFTSAGQLRWVRKIRDAIVVSSSSAMGIRAAVSATGEVAVVASIRYGANIDGVNISAGLSNIGYFVVKYDANGNYVWQALSDQHAASVAFDKFGDVVVSDTGSNFTPGVSKYNGATGERRWRFSPLSGVGSIAIDSNADIVVGGAASAGNSFVSKIKADGTAALWTKPSTGFNRIQGVVIDSLNNVYASGAFSSDLKYGSVTYQPTGSGYYDIFVLKLNSAGTEQWTKPFGGTDHDIGNSIALDANEDVYVTGSYIGAVNFGTATRTSVGASDIFVLKLAKLDGAPQLVRSFGGSGDESGTAIAVDASGAMLIGANAQDSFNVGLLPFSSFGGDDILFFKLQIGGAPALESPSNLRVMP